MNLTADEALERLIEGNRRFVAGIRDEWEVTIQARRQALLQKQTPFAIILGCSDSRAPAEIIFDQGLGDLFVIRVAGNIIAPSLVGSVEFAADQFGTRLVVVLGHTRCGAVQATLDQLQQPTENRSPNISVIVERIRPAVQSLLATNLHNDPDQLMQNAIRANVLASANHLRHGSAILEGLIANDGLRVVGAEYSLETGKVTFFDLG